MQDDTCLYDYNVQNRVDAFVKASEELASVTYGDDILIPFGSDFQWVSAHQYYKNVDKLIHYINKDGRINAFYSTPAEYVAVKHRYNHSWPLKTDDFFPYADCPVCYWTGACCAVLCCAVLCCCIVLLCRADLPAGVCTEMTPPWILCMHSCLAKLLHRLRLPFYKRPVHHQ